MFTPASCRRSQPGINTRIALALVLSIATALSAAAQKASDKPKPPARTPGKTPSPPPKLPDQSPTQTTNNVDKFIRDNGLDPNVMTVESLGLRMNLPLGAAVSAEKMNGKLVLTVNDNPTTPTWTLRVQAMDSSLEKPSPAAQINDLLKELDTNKQAYTIVSNEPKVCGDRTGQLCYLQRTGTGDQPYITGWMILPTAERTFMVFSLQTLPEQLQSIRPSLEASFATVQLRSPTEMASERKSKLEAGRALIASLTPAKLKSLIGQNQTTRIYMPAAQGGSQSEKGYSFIEVVEGKKGELDPAKKESDYDSTERQLGLLVRVKSRIIIDVQRASFYDCIAIYWMAWDQSEEAWSVRGTSRQGEASQTQAETGIRSAAKPGAAPKITVLLADNVKNSRDSFDWLVPDIYLSQALGWVLAKVLPHDIHEPMELGYYFYNSNTTGTQLSQRSDIWEPMPDGSGNFRLTNKITSDSPPTVSVYDKNGLLVRRVHPDGGITEPISMEDLRKLWTSKGLPVGKTPR